MPSNLLNVIAPPGPQLDVAALPAAEIEGLYLHVPFCFHKCHYCDFYSIARQTPARMQQYVDLILREAENWANKGRQLNIRPRTVFFGGGTPTLLPAEQMRRLILGLGQRLDLSAVQEWTVEANPATVSEDYCRMLRQCGVDRLSMGAQSFDLRELKMLERHHQPDDVPAGIDAARAAGFERLNIDLIFAIPGQSLADWMRSLQRAIALGTEHLSCYALTYEPNTAMAVRKRLGEFEAEPMELEIEMLRATRNWLGEAGFQAYEISNFERAEKNRHVPFLGCGHNLNYWRGGNYLGLGPSAASHVSGWRWRNRPHLGEWESAASQDDLAAADVEQLSPLQRAGELAMLMLRLSSGIEFTAFRERTGCEARAIFAEPIERLARAALIEVDDQSVRLSEGGLPVADGVAAEFLEAAAQFERDAARSAVG